MNSQLNTFETFHDRVLKLEKQNRRLKQLGVAALIIPALVLGIGQVLGQAPSRKTVEASEFILRDDVGKVRAKLWMSTANEDMPDYNFHGKPSPTLALFNEQGKITVALKAGFDLDGSATKGDNAGSAGFRRFPLPVRTFRPLLHGVGFVTRLGFDGRTCPGRL